MAFDLRAVEAGISPDALLLVRDFMFSHQGEWIVSKDIARFCNLPVDGTCVELRRTIKYLQYGGYPIVSGVSGFMWAMDKVVVLEAINRESERLRGLQRHVLALQNIYRVMGGNDLEVMYNG